jgi:hypothetical protein
MKRTATVLVLSLGLILSLACGGLGGEAEPCPEPEPCPTDDRCCDADDVLLMSAMGLSDAAMLEAIETDTLEVIVSGEDISRLQQAEISQEVIDALVGAKPAAQTKTGKAAPEVPTLDVSMTYSPGDRSFVLNNHSNTQYTTLVLTANGEYVYRLKRLPVGAEDSIRLVSFVSRDSGQELQPKVGIQKMYITSDQGTWYKSF